MRVVFLVGALDRHGAVERAVTTQATALAAATGHDVRVVSVLRASGKRVATPSVPVTWWASVTDDDARALRARESVLVPGGGDPTLSALSDLALEQHLPRVRADVVVTPTPGLLGAAAQLLPAGVTLVHQEHRVSLPGHPGHEAFLAFAPRAGVVVVSTDREADLVRDRLGDLAPTTWVLPPMLPPGPRPRSLLDQPRIVAGGPLAPEKQHQHMVRAFGRVADRLPGWRLRLLGAGPQREILLQAIRRAGLYDRVELPGPAPDSAAEWAAAGLALLTSRREGPPTHLLEAMAAGVPVIAYDCPTGPADLVSDRHNGLLVTQDDEQGLGSAVLELAGDRDLRTTLGAAALATSRRHRPEVVARQWDELLGTVGSRGRRAAGRLTRRATAPAPPEPELARPRVADLAGLTPRATRRAALELATGVAAASSPEWFVLPAQAAEPPVVVVPRSHRSAYLEALAGATAPAYLSLAVSEDHHWQPRRGPVADTARLLTSTMARLLTLEPWPEVDGSGHHLSRDAGVRIEFWSRTPDGELAAAVPNPFALRVAPQPAPEPAAVEGLTVPVLPGLAGPFVHECDFPVDVVYTWVDDQDPEWRARLDAARRAASGVSTDRENSGAARFRSRDELRYSLRSLHLFAPWVRRIHIVTAGQRPSWLRESPDVRVVDHRDLLPPEALPTFNSHAIETGLHRIPDLAEHFVYFNDDVFLGRPTRPEQFFRPSGQPAVFPAPWPIGVPGRDRRTFVLAADNNRRLLRDRFGVTITLTLAHTPHPHRRSVLEQLTREFPAEIEATARSTFRADHDLSVASSLAQHYGLITGAAVESHLEERFVDLSGIAVQRKLNRLNAREWDTFCLGDQHDYALPPDEVGELLHSFLESYFPVRPPWEA